MSHQHWLNAEENKMEKKQKDLPPIISWISAMCGITGTPIYVILQFILGEEQAKIIGISISIVVVIIGVFILREQNYKNKRILADKNREVEIKNQEIEEKNRILLEEKQKIEELNNRISACKKVIADKDKDKLTPVDYYLIDKDEYDNFKTDLRISECLLEVELNPKNTDLEKKDLLKFKWTLKVENDTSEPMDKADFIFSGLKDQDISPTVTTEKVTYKDTIRKNIKVLGEDCFIVILFTDEIQPGHDAIIHINYDLEYDFNRKNDYVWLVPDALGFACMDKFYIRFYSDGDVIHEGTRAELKSYKLNMEYTPENMKWIRFKEFDNGRKGFEATTDGRDELHGYGFLLELRND